MDSFVLVLIINSHLLRVMFGIHEVCRFLMNYASSVVKSVLVDIVAALCDFIPGFSDQFRKKISFFI